MYRKIAQRRIAALALVTILAFAGAQPAAAADLGLLDRLANFWSAVSGEESTGIWNTLVGWLGDATKALQESDARELGAGIDPTGGELTPGSTVPTVGGGD